MRNFKRTSLMQKIEDTVSVTLKKRRYRKDTKKCNSDKKRKLKKN